MTVWRRDLLREVGWMWKYLLQCGNSVEGLLLRVNTWSHVPCTHSKEHFCKTHNSSPYTNYVFCVMVSWCGKFVDLQKSVLWGAYGVQWGGICIRMIRYFKSTQRVCFVRDRKEIRRKPARFRKRPLRVNLCIEAWRWSYKFVYEEREYFKYVSVSKNLNATATYLWKRRNLIFSRRGFARCGRSGVWHSW